MSLKYLLSFIDDKAHLSGVGAIASDSADTLIDGPNDRDNAAIGAADLKQILTDAKEGLEIKNTTNEFFETLERIVLELRGMTEHSTAFLNRVRKSDAPDYYTVIKNPMDLGTILKKVKAQHYKDKAGFKEDLDLIWENCYTYNTLPTHPLRKSAGILRNRADHLLEFVTDPTVATAQVHQSQPGLSHVCRHGSRLDALDAAHEIDNTAADAWQPFGFNENIRSGAIPRVNGFRSRDRSFSQRPPHESDEWDADDGNDTNMDEYGDVDESIKTRKGLASLKTQPGGGRNLDLLRGLANQNDSHSSLHVNGSTTRSVSPMSPRRSPSPAETALPQLPGSFPGQGSALLARRATVSDHIVRAKSTSSRQRNASSGQKDLHRKSFREWSALLRTSDNMALYDSFLRASVQDGKHAVDTVSGPSKLRNVPHMPHAPGSALIATLVGLPKRARRERSVSAHDNTPDRSQMQRNRSRSMLADEHDEPDLRLWEIATSEQFARAALPVVPFADSLASDTRTLERRKRKRLKTDAGGQQAIQSHFAEDIRNLERSKRLRRRISALRHDNGSINLPEAVSDSEEDTSCEIVPQPERSKRKSANDMTSNHRIPTQLLGTNQASTTARSAVQRACTTVLRYTGFDGADSSADATLVHLLRQYLSNLGRTAAFYTERFGRRWSANAIIMQTLAENTLHNDREDENPVVLLQQYLEHNIPAASKRIQAVATQLQAVYAKEIDLAAAQEPAMPLNDLHTGPETDNLTDQSGHLLRILSAVDPDLLHFTEAGIDHEARFDLQELYDSLLRLLYPSASANSQPPFDPPPHRISLTADGIRHQIGLLQPFLQARRSTPYELWDDDAAPSGQAEDEVRRVLYMRPEASTITGRVLVGKRKREMLAVAPTMANSGFSHTASMPDKKAAKPSLPAVTIPNGVQFAVDSAGVDPLKKAKFQR